MDESRSAGVSAGLYAYLPEGTAGYQFTPGLGHCVPLTGLQLFVRANCKLGLPGQSAVDVSPAVLQFPDPAPVLLSADIISIAQFAGWPPRLCVGQTRRS